LYSINVFITFCLSQAGMVKHWWKSHERGWQKKLLINGSGLVLCVFILFSVVILKFHDGGWITLVITGSFIGLAVLIKRHYQETFRQLGRLEELVKTVGIDAAVASTPAKMDFDPKSKVAVILVNGYNGLGLHTLFNVIRLFGKEFRNFLFVEVGVINAGNFKGVEEVENLQKKIADDVAKYVRYMNGQGYYADGISFTGLEVISEVEERSEAILRRYPSAVFFGGQLVFAQETLAKRILHNYTVFALQSMFYRKGIPFVILPIRVP